MRLQCYEGIDAAAALYEWNYPRQLLAIRQARAPAATSTSTTTSFLIERPLLAGAAPPGRDRAADRRDRPLRPRVRGLPARIPLRLPDLDSRARHDPRRRAAGRDPHLQPHARAARGAAPPLRLSLDRLSRRRSARRASSMLRAATSREPRRAPWSPPSGDSARGRWPSRPASPKPSTGPRPRPCCNEHGAPWPDAFRRSLGVLIKDEEDFVHAGAEDRRRFSPRRRHERRGAHRSLRFLGFAALLRRSVLPSRPSRLMRLARCDRAFSAPPGSAISAAPRTRHWRRRPTASPNSTRCSTRIFSATLVPAIGIGDRATRSRRAPPTIRPADQSRSSARTRMNPARKATGRREAFGAPLRAPAARTSAAPLRPRRCRRAAAAARLSLARRARRRRHRSRGACFARPMRTCRRVIRLRRRRRRLRQRRILLLDRRLRLDEGAHRGASALRPCAGRAPPTRSRSSPSARG